MPFGFGVTYVIQIIQVKEQFYCSVQRKLCPIMPKASGFCYQAGEFCLGGNQI